MYDKIHQKKKKKSLLSRERETVKHWIIIMQGLLESDVKISLGTNG